MCVQEVVHSVDVRERMDMRTIQLQKEVVTAESFHYGPQTSQIIFLGTRKGSTGKKFNISRKSHLVPPLSPELLL